jgi:hypothetical protein
MVEVQVKTSTTFQRPSWLPGRVASSATEREWMSWSGWELRSVIVRAAFVVPRDHVAAGTWINHMHWLTDPSVPRR